MHDDFDREFDIAQLERSIDAVSALLDQDLLRGRDGKDADPEVIRATVREVVAEALRELPPARDGKDGRAGRDVDPAALKLLVEQVVRSQVKDGTPGPRGPEGPIGPMPKHEWSGTKLRFEEEPGVWGEWVDLVGPAGKPGRTQIVGGGASAAPAAPVYGYFPMGW